MNEESARYDVVVIGSGPGGSTAALEAARLGRKVLVIERERTLGGGCVSRGTIPSKTLQHLAKCAPRTPAGALLDEPDLEQLRAQVARVTQAHSHDYALTLREAGVTMAHGKARLRATAPGAHAIELVHPGGGHEAIEAGAVVLATGSVPRLPPGIEIDHEHVLDSDSLLSLSYLPQSICVLGAGVIGCEYASIFAELGVRVTLVHAGERPMPFLDESLLQAFTRRFAAHGGALHNEVSIERASAQGLGAKVTLSDGSVITCDKALCALGRTPNSKGLFEPGCGIVTDSRGYIEVDANCQTAVPGVYAVGDVVGAPTLASAAMEEGRRAAWHLCARPPRVGEADLPMAIFTLPVLTSVGLTERAATERFGAKAAVGKVRWDETSRGRIDGEDGALKLVSDPEGERILGVHIYGASAAELVGIGQAAIIAGWSVEELVSNVFCFPTLAEAYRIAALRLLAKVRSRSTTSPVSAAA